MDLWSINNQVGMIIITGASGGIGSQLMLYYGFEDHDMIGTYNNTIPDYYPEKCYKLDITNYDDVCKFVTEIRPSYITLINCAGINYNSFTHKSDVEEWKKVIDVNLIGTYHMIRSLLPIMREEKYGRIINLSSILATKSVNGTSAYSASKSALKGLINVIAIENASMGITINNIELGYSEFGMIKEVSDIVDIIPMGKLCGIEDVINTIEYLRNTEYITGTNITLSGGL